MPKLSLDVAHTLTPDEAVRRLKRAFLVLRAEHHGSVSNLTEEWLENTFSFAFKAMGMAVSGTVAVEPQKVSLAANLPFAAMMFKGTIEDRIRQEVAKILAPEAAAG